MKKSIDSLKNEMKVYDNVLKQIDKDLMKAQSKGWGATSSFLTEAKPKIEILKQKKTFPKSPFDLKDVDVSIKSKILKAELKSKFPKIPFQVKSSRYSGGSSINVGWTDGVAPSKVRPIVEKYSYDKGSDSMTDYFNVDNYAFAQRNISNWNTKIEKVKSDLRKKRQDLAQADEWKVEQEANYTLNNMDLPIENLKKQMRGTFK
jgi:hypothetical protein